MTYDVHTAPAASRPQAEGKVRVVIADDHPLLRFGLRSMLAGYADIAVVGEAADGLEAVELCASVRPDVVLMDLQMPVLSGFQSMERIRQVAPACKILVVTTFQGDAHISRALKAGATGYLLKASLRGELREAIVRAHRGERQLSPEVAMTLAHSYNAPEVAPREREVLLAAAQGNSNKLIARKMEITEGTVKCHMKSIFDKLGARDRTHAVAIALRRGVIDL